MSRSLSSRSDVVAALVLALVVLGCGPKNSDEAETKRDVTWLAANPTGESIAALGRLADSDEKALAVLESRAETDENVHIAAWQAVLRNAAWGSTMIRKSLGDPNRAELAARALPRKDARLVPFINDLENAVVRLAAGRRGAVIAGILASIGPQAHAVIERRLIDAKTRGVMCDGIALPEASGDAKSTLLAVPVEARDNPSCVTAVMDMAATEDVVVGWLATGAEPGLLSVAAKSTLPCPRLAAVWKKALAERPSEHQPAMTVPLARSVNRCATILDPVLGDLLAKSPRARATIVSALDPFGPDLQSMKETCNALRAGAANGEIAGVRERAENAIARSCTFAR